MFKYAMKEIILSLNELVDTLNNNEIIGCGTNGLIIK